MQNQFATSIGISFKVGLTLKRQFSSPLSFKSGAFHLLLPLHTVISNKPHLAASLAEWPSCSEWSRWGVSRSSDHTSRSPHPWRSMAFPSPTLIFFHPHIHSSMKSLFSLDPFRMAGTFCQCWTSIAARNTLGFHGRFSCSEYVTLFLLMPAQSHSRFPRLSRFHVVAARKLECATNAHTEQHVLCNPCRKLLLSHASWSQATEQRQYLQFKLYRFKEWFSNSSTSYG